MSTFSKKIYDFIRPALYFFRFLGIILFLVLALFLVIATCISEHTSIAENAAIKDLNNNVFVLPDAQSIHKKFEGKNVYVQGKVETQGILINSEFGIEANSLALECKVSYFQWYFAKRSERSFMQPYKKAWASHLSNVSAKENTLIADYKEFQEFAKDACLGAYAVSSKILSSFPMPFYAYSVQLSLQERENIQKMLLEKAQNHQKFSESILAYKDLVSKGENPSLVHILQNGSVYLGLEPQNPRIGDMQLSFSLAPREVTISAIARQNGNTLESYTNEHGETITTVIQSGDVDLARLLRSALFETSDFQWMVRIAMPCLFAIIIWIFCRLSGIKDNFILLHGRVTWQSRCISMLAAGVFLYLLIFILIYGYIQYARSL